VRVHVRVCLHVVSRPLLDPIMPGAPAVEQEVSVWARSAWIRWDEHATAPDLCHPPWCHLLPRLRQREGQGQGQAGRSNLYSVSLSSRHIVVRPHLSLSLLEVLKCSQTNLSLFARGTEFLSNKTSISLPEVLSCSPTKPQSVFVSGSAVGKSHTKLVGL
jgi:hypothetical protein